MKPTAVITGANRGIGFALMKYLLQRGSHDIFAIVRNSAAAEPTAKRGGDIVLSLPSGD